MALKILFVSGMDLHFKYRDREYPQPCRVVLDVVRETLTAEVDDWVPGMATYLSDDVVLGFQIPALRADAANDLLKMIKPLAVRVCAGYPRDRSLARDPNEQYGEYSDDAQNAIDTIGALCEDTRLRYNEIETMDAGDYMEPLGTPEQQAKELRITASTTDEQVNRIEGRLLREARKAGLDGIDGLTEYLERLRDKCREEDRCRESSEG